MAIDHPVTCPQCSKAFVACTARINIAKKKGTQLYCSQACFGRSRRLKKPPTAEQKKLAKQEYDKKRRQMLGDTLRKKKRDAYYANHDAYKAKHAVYRKKRMPKHVEYCRQPWYRKYKQKYDQKYRAEKFYGDFSEAFLTLLNMESELDKQASPHERRLQNGTYNKSLSRRRALCLTN